MLQRSGLFVGSSMTKVMGLRYDSQLLMTTGELNDSKLDP